MASLIQKKETGIWYFVYTDNGRQRWKSLRTKDKATARRQHVKLEVKLDQQKSGLAPRKLLIDDVFGDYLAKKEESLKPRTFEQYQRQAGTVKSNLHAEYVHQLTTSMLEDYVSARKKQGVSNKTIKEELCVLKAALSQAYKAGLLSEMPVRSWPAFDIVPVAPDTLGFYSLAEVEILKQHFAGRLFEPIFLFALYTGARRGEMQELRPISVNLAEKTVKIRNSKTESKPENQFRFVPIHPNLMPVMVKLMAKTKPGKPLFPLLTSNNHNYAAKTMTRACLKLGIQYKRFHGLRHCAATYLLSAGVPLRDIMQLMGWTQLATAQKYIHMSNNAAEQMAKLPY